MFRPAFLGYAGHDSISSNGKCFKPIYLCKKDYQNYIFTGARNILYYTEWTTKFWKYLMLLFLKIGRWRYMQVVTKEPFILGILIAVEHF